MNSPEFLIPDLVKWIIGMVSGSGMLAITLFALKKFYERNVEHELVRVGETSEKCMNLVLTVEERIHSMGKELFEIHAKVSRMAEGAEARHRKMETELINLKKSLMPRGKNGLRNAKH